MIDKYLSVFDLISTFFWMAVMLFFAHFHYLRNNHKSYYKYYLWNIYSKFFFALAFSVYYVAIFQGGDTVAYFDSAAVLNDLFIYSPGEYFEVLFSEPDPSMYWYTFNSESGYPPGWIYREPEAFFVSKIISLFSFLTFKSYLATSLIIAFMVAHASWKLFTLVLELKLTKPVFIALAILFIPSVNFWCTGISKDSFVYMSLCYIIYYTFKLIRYGRLKATEYMIFFLAVFVLFHIRSVILFITVVPIGIVVASKLAKRGGMKNFAVSVIRTMVLLVGFVAIISNLASKTEDELLTSNSFLQQASVIQEDFANNESYGDNRYDLGDIEFTLGGLLRIAPIAVFTGAFRPMIWEALQPNLILNGLESLLLIFGVLRFLVFRPISKFQFIRNNEFLYFCLIFVFLMSFITGLTSGLYGVLVRLRAPLLPFLFILLNVNYKVLAGTLKPGRKKEPTEA